MLIGLTGRAGSGKDTVYETLAETYAEDMIVERRSFADPLYESAAAALGVTVEDLREWKRDPSILVEVRRNKMSAYDPLARQTVRQYLQRYGTEAHREVFGEDFWIEAARLKDHPGRLVCVTDVRFPNEATAVHRAGGYVVEVVGPGEAGAGGHASEEPLPGDLVDFIIPNTRRDDDFESLKTRCRTLVGRLLYEGA